MTRNLYILSVILVIGGLCLSVLAWDLLWLCVAGWLLWFVTDLTYQPAYGPLIKYGPTTEEENQ